MNMDSTWFSQGDGTGPAGSFPAGELSSSETQVIPEIVGQGLVLRRVLDANLLAWNKKGIYDQFECYDQLSTQEDQPC